MGFSNLVYQVENVGWHFICDPDPGQLKKTMKTDKHYLRKLFDNAIKDKVKVQTALSVIKKQKSQYLKMVDLFNERIKKIHNMIKKYDYKLMRMDKKTSKTTKYSRVVIEVGRELLAEEIPIVNETICEIEEYLKAEFDPVIIRLESLQDPPIPGRPAEQTDDMPDDYKLSDWYKKLSHDNQIEINKILEKQEKFRPYINKMFNKGYFAVDIDGNPALNTDKLKQADLKRLIKKLTPEGLYRKFKDWENFLDLEKPLKNCSDIEKSKSFIAILKDLGIEE